MLSEMKSQCPVHGLLNFKRRGGSEHNYGRQLVRQCIAAKVEK